MAVKFNPFTGQLQIDEKGSGGGSSYIDGEVATYSDLPLDGTAALNSAWLVREASGTWLLNRKPAGIYIRTANTGTRASDWTYAGEFPDVFSDANFVLYDNGDSTKNLQFQLSGISTGTVRTITMPDANVTLPDQGTSTGDSPTFAQVTINDTVNEVSTLTLADTSYNNIEFAAQELTLRHTGAADTPYINVTDGTDYALLGVRQGDMFLQGSNPVVRIEKTGGGLADIKVNKLVLEDATTAGDPTATFDADGNLTASRTYDLPDASGTIALTSDFAAPPAIGSTTPAAGTFTTLSANNGTLTASAPVLDLSQTWNNAAVTFTGVKFDVTATAAASNSIFSDIQAGGYSQFAIARISSTSNACWIYNTNSGTNTNGVGANYERGFMRWSSNVLQIGTEAAGTGTQRQMQFSLGTVTADTPLLVTQTWNNSSVNFTAFRIDVTNTASQFSGASSNIQDWRVGGVQVAYVTTSGAIVCRGFGTAANGAISVNSCYTMAGPAGGVMEVRQGTTPMDVRFFNTVSGTNNVNFERANLRWASNEFIIDTAAGGNGTLRGIKIGSATSSLLGFYGATPVTQRAAIADATDAATTQARLNDLLATMRTFGLIAT